jgi:putative nucleotidyltransferase with HDIG domain
MTNQQELIKTIPEFLEISIAGLRQKTIDCWQEAIQMGGWQIADLQQIPFTLLIPNCTTSFLTHVQAVTSTAIAVAKVLESFYKSLYTINMDFIVSGGLLHDIGKLVEYQRNQNVFGKSEMGKLLRHPFSGAALAMKHNLPAEVIHIIAVHAKEGDLGYRSPEAIIVHHADFINFEPLKK